MLKPKGGIIKSLKRMLQLTKVQTLSPDEDVLHSEETLALTLVVLKDLEIAHPFLLWDLPSSFPSPPLCVCVDQRLMTDFSLWLLSHVLDRVSH